MTLQEILTGGGVSLVVLMTLVQIAPVKINPWSAIAKGIGHALNTDVMEQLKAVRSEQEKTRAALDEHIRVDDERNADEHRYKILRFNTELLRDGKHTQEDFIEVLAEIDAYEEYCQTHADYKNNRAAHAIANINRVYDDRLKHHDFL